MDNELKIMAIYLPAFHRIKENDEWWGEGFTEWNNVKKGKPLFKGHIQPQEPLNDFYYDLSKKEDIVKQVKLANDYGIDGFICYHYWFNGHKLLEKPCEIILNNPDIDINYSFCWANEPWARTWDGKNHEILINQEYGEEKEWKEHIDYLIPFFQDKRYIKINNRPVLYIYSVSQIPNFDRMLEFWNQTLKKKGMEDIYLVEYISTRNPQKSSQYTSAVLEFEPMYTNRFKISNIRKIIRLLKKKLGKIDFGDYDYLWNKILKNNRTYGDNVEIFKGAFSGWDNSPRKGKKSMIVKNGSPEKFLKYLLLLAKKKRSNKNVIVINAWNEWGEGAILEPTKQYSYEYLKSVKKVKTNYES